MSTKRFISATRAEGVRWAKVSAFLVVRNLEKDCSLCVQAAIKASRSAAVGASGALVAVAAPARVAELDSCGTNAVVASDSSAAKTITARAAHRTTLVLCRGKNGRQILREGRARHHFITSRGASLRGQIRLYVR